MKLMNERALLTMLPQLLTATELKLTTRITFSQLALLCDLLETNTIPTKVLDLSSLLILSKAKGFFFPSGHN